MDRSWITSCRRLTFLAVLTLSLSTSSILGPSTGQSFGVDAFQPYFPSREVCANKLSRYDRPITSLSASADKQQSTQTKKKTTLTEETTWTARFVLRGLTTNKKQKMDQIFSIQAQFVEEEGYEPPQGTFRVVSATDDNPTMQFKINRARWILSEDPNDRKDGLWVWGLFKEPLYPFLLLNIETDAIPLPRNDNDDDKEADFLPPMRLYAQINHKRDTDNDGSVMLDRNTELQLKQVETVKADIFGAAEADIMNEVPIGTLSIEPNTN